MEGINFVCGIRKAYKVKFYQYCRGVGSLTGGDSLNENLEGIDIVYLGERPGWLVIWDCWAGGREKWKVR